MAATPQSLIRPDILAMAGYHVPSAAGLIKLDAMENPYRLSPALQEALGERLAKLPINRYPVPSYSALKEKLRATMQVPEGADLLIGNGSDELITLITVATARPGATVLALAPSFVMYALSAQLAGSQFVSVPLRADFSLDTDAMLAAIEMHQPAVIWLAYPNNPTGLSFDRIAIERILAAAPGLVVIDEAYRPFARDTWMDALPEHPALVVLRTVSKLGLAGIRIGYLAAAPHWVAEFDKVRPPYNVSVLDEAAAEFALEHIDVLDAQCAQLRADRDALQPALAALPGVLACPPSDANFLLVKVSDPSATLAALRARGVLVKDVSRMHPILSGCLRVTVGTPAENTALLEALRGALAVSP